MVDKSRMTLQKLARWHPTQSNPGHDRKGSAALWEGTLQVTDHEDLKQGALYIIKIYKVSVCLFQGWNDDMCCFAVLRSESGPLRWSQARYLPGDFDAFDAFDEAGNPPVHLWTRYLHVDVPVNWFVIFEEARRKQREWATFVLGQPQQQYQQEHHQYDHDPSSTGTNTGLQTGVIVDRRPHHQLQQQSYEAYSDLDTFSAAPSQSLQSERMTSISSLHLPLDADLREDANLPSPSLPPAPASLFAANVDSPPHSPIAVNMSSSSSQSRSQTNESDQPHLSDTPLQPSDKYNTASSVQPMGAGSNEMNHQISRSQQYTTSSLPNVTMKTQIPPISPTTITNKQAITDSPSSKQLEMTLDGLSFPHDDDQFSIHSDYQPNANTPESAFTNDQCNNHTNNTGTTWKKNSIKKILSRPSSIAK